MNKRLQKTGIQFIYKYVAEKEDNSLLYKGSYLLFDRCILIKILFFVQSRYFFSRH
ncbi:hypothetical protein DJ94_4808 [Bacillus pseudomycoides]|nr:hypothetical protein DJ94_4808 [Bacillus pseudomycoides]